MLSIGDFVRACGHARANLATQYKLSLSILLAPEPNEKSSSNAVMPRMNIYQSRTVISGLYKTGEGLTVDIGATPTPTGIELNFLKSPWTF